MVCWVGSVPGTIRIDPATCTGPENGRLGSTNRWSASDRDLSVRRVKRLVFSSSQPSTGLLSISYQVWCIRAESSGVSWLDFSIICRRVVTSCYWLLRSIYVWSVRCNSVCVVSTNDQNTFWSFNRIHSTVFVTAKTRGINSQREEKCIF